MSRILGLSAPALLALGGIMISCGGASSGEFEIARGKYLVEDVAKCANCHSQRSPEGKLDATRWLQGADLGFQPIHPMPVWARYAPEISGLPGMTPENGVRLLTTGIGPAGQPLRPPMPDFRMTEDDAKAVVAYLRTLPMSGSPVQRTP
jgi:mono/diheme cytochrome c family protein